MTKIEKEICRKIRGQRWRKEREREIYIEKHEREREREKEREKEKERGGRRERESLKSYGEKKNLSYPLHQNKLLNIFDSRIFCFIFPDFLLGFHLDFMDTVYK